jgi:hypothetical protein
MRAPGLGAEVNRPPLPADIAHALCGGRSGRHVTMPQSPAARARFRMKFNTPDALSMA